MHTSAVTNHLSLPMKSARRPLVATNFSRRSKILSARTMKRTFTRFTNHSVCSRRKETATWSDLCTLTSWATTESQSLSIDAPTLNAAFNATLESNPSLCSPKLVPTKSRTLSLVLRITIGARVACHKSNLFVTHPMRVAVSSRWSFLWMKTRKRCTFAVANLHQLHHFATLKHARSWWLVKTSWTGVWIPGQVKKRKRCQRLKRKNPRVKMTERLPSEGLSDKTRL